ncbi:MAG TPA: NAD(P)H-binding protein [Candidatus Didemnitutus sp.]|nr:NAD(P)H-binding protein [Candidatus Didemnitutus sp.]
MSAAPRHILVTGGTGYLGRAVTPVLLRRGHRVRLLVRSEPSPPIPGVEIVRGNPLDPASIAGALEGIDTLVHLVGVPKPSPAKARQFREVDLASIQASVSAASACSQPPHLIYLSVAQPAPIMKAYLAVRAEGEALIAARGLRGTFLRPWYVLGPGHRWPMFLLPVYFLLGILPPTRESARRLGFVTLDQMVAALVYAVENPPEGIRIVDVPAIRASTKKDEP